MGRKGAFRGAEHWGLSVSSVNVLPGSAIKECRNVQDEDGSCGANQTLGGHWCCESWEDAIRTAARIFSGETRDVQICVSGASRVDSTSLIDLLAVKKWFSTMFRCSRGI